MHSERPKFTILAFLSAIGLIEETCLVHCDLDQLDKEENCNKRTYRKIYNLDHNFLKSRNYHIGSACL